MAGKTFKMKHKTIILDSTYPTFKELTEKLEISKENTFLAIIKDLTIKINNNYSDSIFYINLDNKKIFELNKRYKDIWVNYELLWLIFENEYNMEHEEIRKFIKNMLKKHLNLKGLRPYIITIETIR